MDARNLTLVCDHRGDGLAERIESLSLAGVRIEISNNLPGTLERLRRERPGLLLIDALARGGQVEFEAIEELCRGEPQVPVLLVAEGANPIPTLIASEVFDRGLWDLIYRDAPLEEYARRMGRLRAQAHTMTEVDDLRYRAAHDDRTDLLRPSAFQLRLTEHFSAAQRHHFDLALALIDLDDFGKINKIHDHTVGDRVIAAVGATIRETLRAEDVAGRLGGDEFGVLLPYTPRVDAARVIQRLQAGIHALTGQIDEVPADVVVSASLGFDTFSGSEHSSAAEFRQRAEVALRRAKKSGGNRCVYYRSLQARGQDDG